jgi:hypothetical protein
MGKMIAYQYLESAPVGVSRIAVAPDAGGTPLHDFVPAGENGLHWSPDGKGVQFLLTRNGATNVWEQPLSGGAPRRVTDFTAGLLFDFAWSRDGTQLLLVKGKNTSDIILVSNFR